MEGSIKVDEIRIVELSLLLWCVCGNSILGSGVIRCEMYAR